MLTRRGWLLGVTSIIFTISGRLLGLVELYVLAVAALTLTIAAVAYVRLTRFQLEAIRELRPPRVSAGTASRVELSVRNTATTQSPVLTARDPFDGGRRWARFLLAPLSPGETARAAYRLPTDRRGIYDLGPLELELADPLRLAATSLVAAPVTKLTVYPRIDRITALPLTRGNDPMAGSDHPTALSHAGEDFYALRDYTEGDDMRRVHWRATAKVDSLMIRQDEMPWQGRATVVLDLRRNVHTGDSVEIAVSAAASIVTASWQRRSLIRLAATDGRNSGFGAGAAHVEAILEYLAGAHTDSSRDLLMLVASLRHEGNGGALAIITTAGASDADIEGIARLRSRYAVSLVLIERSAMEPDRAVPPAAGRSAPAGSVVRVTADRPFQAAWEEIVGGGRYRRLRTGVR